MKKYHVKKGDDVVVNIGEWAGKEGKILAILPKKDRVVLELAGLTEQEKNRIGKKTVKKSKQNPNGGLIERSISVHVSNVNPKKTE